jgi:hypothetical protein
VSTSFVYFRGLSRLSRNLDSRDSLYIQVESTFENATSTKSPAYIVPTFPLQRDTLRHLLCLGYRASGNLLSEPRGRPVASFRMSHRCRQDPLYSRRRRRRVSCALVQGLGRIPFAARDQLLAAQGNICSRLTHLVSREGRKDVQWRTLVL